ncbi:MAG: hypothetical protein U9Q37_08525 [Euryarchaeota archaeon]|nr:hypothetical protein [Euryarchaeota archaeon]
MSVLTASESSRTATVKAELEVVLKLKSSTTVEFLERKTERDKKQGTRDEGNAKESMMIPDSCYLSGAYTSVVESTSVGGDANHKSPA